MTRKTAYLVIALVLLMLLGVVTRPLWATSPALMRLRAQVLWLLSPRQFVASAEVKPGDEFDSGTLRLINRSAEIIEVDTAMLAVASKDCQRTSLMFLAPTGTASDGFTIAFNPDEGTAKFFTIAATSDIHLNAGVFATCYLMKYFQSSLYPTNFELPLAAEGLGALNASVLLRLPRRQYEAEMVKLRNPYIVSPEEYLRAIVGLHDAGQEGVPLRIKKP